MYICQCSAFNMFMSYFSSCKWKQRCVQIHLHWSGVMVSKISVRLVGFHTSVEINLYNFLQRGALCCNKLKKKNHISLSLQLFSDFCLLPCRKRLQYEICRRLIVFVVSLERNIVTFLTCYVTKNLPEVWAAGICVLQNLLKYQMFYLPCLVRSLKAVVLHRSFPLRFDYNNISTARYSFSFISGAFEISL